MQADPQSTDHALVSARPTGCDRLIRFYETLTPDTLAEIEQVYHPQAHFKDPFNTVNGTDAIRRICEHMFSTVGSPRFRVTEHVQQGTETFLVWNFSFERGGPARTTLTIHGVSHVRFHADGRVIMHRDYWDPAEELYEKLPMLGGLMRWLKARLKAQS